MPISKLTVEECRIYGIWAIERFLQSRLSGIPDAHGYKPGEKDLQTDLFAVWAEAAYNKWRGRWFAGSVNTFKEADSGDNVQIRSTMWSNGKLIIRKNDPPDHYYVLVVCNREDPLTYRIVGWMHGRDARRREWLWDAGKGDRPPAWFVPQGKLREFNG